MITAAFIPLRGGSKSIPNKNLRPVAGKPLFAWVTEAAANCEKIDRVVVCTDDERIAEAARLIGSSKIQVVGRSPETATDTASTESVMLEYAAMHEDFDRIILIQATSPLLSTHDLTGGINLLESSNADSLLSGVEQKRFIWNRQDNGMATPTNYDPAGRPRRQDFSPYFVENGAFYICSRADLLRTKCRLSGKIAFQVMPEESFYELDEPSDLKIIESLLRERTLKEQQADGFFSSVLAGIKLIVSDVDGVLTDSGMYYSETGDELKKFNTRDGKGFELLRNAGIKTAIITSEKTALVERRAAKLKIDFLYQGAVDKLPAFSELLDKSGVLPQEVAYVGDDLGDIPVFHRAGFTACPYDAIPEILSLAHYRAGVPGGGGVIREVAELILKARGELDGSLR